MNSLHSTRTTGSAPDQYSRQDQLDSSDAPNNERTVLPTQRARQGVTGHNVRYVLSFGIAAVVVVFAAIWLVYFA
jgi:hypothetical protein